MSQGNREQLQQVAALIKAGKRAEATKILVPLLKTDPNNASGWWLMANAVSDTEHKKRALKRFLQLRPDDEKAKAMLLKLEPPIDHDPFDDPENPFVAAKRTDTLTAIQNNMAKQQDTHPFGAADDDDPFGDVGEDDPFAEKPEWDRVSSKNGTQTRLSKGAASRAEKSTKTRDNSWIIIVGVMILAVCGVVAVVAFVALRNAPRRASTVSNENRSSYVPADFVEAEFHCSENESGTVIREFGVGSALIPGDYVGKGDIHLGETVSGYFDGDFMSEGEHHYSFEGHTGQWLVIEIFSVSDPIDPEIRVYDPGTRILAWCSNMRDDTYAYMEIELPTDGIYRLSAGQFFTLEGSYQMTVREL